jgi:hypothetical protein
MGIQGRLLIAALAAAACFVGATGVAGATPHADANHRAVQTTRLTSSGVTFAGPYTTWDWPDAGYSDIEERLTIGRQTGPNAHLFYAHQFDMVNGSGGYIGLQEGSDTGTKIALFSIWSANGAKGRNCGPFEENGTGFTCRIDPFNWKPGRTYELEVERDGTDSLGTWYKASVLDTVTSARTIVGDLRVPKSWGGIQGWISWTEDFAGPVATCSDLPRSRVLWQFPTADHGAVTISGHENIVHDADCRARINDVPNGVAQVIRY